MAKMPSGLAQFAKKKDPADEEGPESGEDDDDAAPDSADDMKDAAKKGKKDAGKKNPLALFAKK